MSKAEKMFNELGFEKTHITYRTKPIVRWIKFDKYGQRVEFSKKGYQTFGIYNVTTRLHDAISQQLLELKDIQQMKELGWLE